MTFEKTAGGFKAPPLTESALPDDTVSNLEERIDALLQLRTSKTRLPADIKQLFARSIQAVMRETSTAWCFWVAGIIILNSGFDYFTAPEYLFPTLFGIRLAIAGSFVVSGLLLNGDILPKFTNFYTAAPCVLAIILAGIAGRMAGNPGLLMNVAVVAPESAIMFIGLDMAFNFSLVSVCLPLVLWFWATAHLQPFAARLQMPFFDACTMFGLIYARRVQNLILHRLFLVNMREKLRNSRGSLRQAQLSSLVYTDKLTDIPNRRYFDETCAGINELTQNVLPLSLCMIDIDHFKKLNDSLGHLQGDRCLKLVAGVIRNNLRNRTDIVARFGGEEFVVMLAGTDMSGALETAERIRLAIMELEHPNPGASIGVVTVSIGVAEISAAPFNVMLLLQHADQALYRAKFSGRNHISI